MDATTMPLAHSLLNSLESDFSDFTFTLSDSFEWHPADAAITYDPNDPYFESRLLHELSHAILGHQSYERDIDLIAMERDAWQHAKMKLGPKYKVEVPGDIIHHDMDTYRDWLHARSTCPHCESTGIQTKKQTYQCVTCRKIWRVNEARTCSLRRYKLDQNK